MSLRLAVFSGKNGHGVGDHEGGVEAHAELTDDVHARAAVLVQLLLELEGAALGDRAEILLHLLLAHADAVVRDGQQAELLIHAEVNREILAVQADVLIGQGEIGQLVDRVAGVGDELAQENLLVGVNRIDHQIQQPLGFGFELFLCHRHSLFFVSFGTQPLRVLKLL